MILHFNFKLIVNLATHTIKVFCFFFHFRDLKKKSPDFASELEWNSFVNSSMKLIKREGNWRRLKPDKSSDSPFHWSAEYLSGFLFQIFMTVNL